VFLNNKGNMTDSELAEKLKSEHILKRLNSAQEVQDWFYNYLDIKFPMGTVYPTSTHGPVEAAWEIYRLIKTGESKFVPEAVMLSSRDSFKCQVKGSKLLTPNGLKNIEDIKIGEIVWSGFAWRKVTNWIDDGFKKGVKITLSNNVELTSTPIHRYWILRDGKEQWCRVNELIDGDLVCFNLDTGLSNKNLVEDDAAFEEGYSLGILAKDSFAKYCYKNNSAMMGFFCGLFDTYGTFDSNNSINITAATKSILKETQIVLASWGVDSKYDQNFSTHHLIINEHEIKKLHDRGFKSKTKKIENTQRDKEAWSISSKTDSITKNKWYPVIKKEELDSAHFFDLTVEVDHSYWSNGSISHNTLVASAIMVLLMAHFRLQLATAGAIKSQSDKMIQYITGHFRKIEKYLLENGWSKISESKARTDWLDENGGLCFVRVVVATIAGMNSEHVPVLCIDGKTNILIKNTGDAKRDRVNRTASGLYLSFNKGKKIEFLSFNHEKGVLEFKKITKAFKSKKDLHKITLETEIFTGKNSTKAQNDKSKRTKTIEVIASLDHPFFVLGKGYIPLREIKEGEKLFYLNKAVSKNSAHVTNLKTEKDEFIENFPKDSDQLEQLLIGSLLGDGGCYQKKGNNAFFAETHGEKQEEYVLYKKEIFEKNDFKVSKYNIQENGFSKKPAVRICTGNTPRLNKWSGFKTDMSLAERIGPEGLMYWYADDGNSGISFVLNTQGFTFEQNMFLKSVLKNNFNINVQVKEVKKDENTYYILNGGCSEKHKMIKLLEKYNVYIPSSVKYKFILQNTEKTCTACGALYTTKDTDNMSDYCGAVECQNIRLKGFYSCKVISIKEHKKNATVYDFTVEDNHNFFANNILVHNCIDEVDVIQDKRALDEGKNIPCLYTNSLGERFFPMTVYLSTRKFAGGLMELTIKNTQKSGGKILRWNIIDITERITKEEAKVDEPKVTRYISRQLPLRNLSPEQWADLNEQEQHQYEKFEAYAGIAEHPMLSVMKNYLVDRPQDDAGFLYKDVQEVLNKLKQNSPDMGEAQLLCNQPSSVGLVYPNFSSTENVISIVDAHEKLSGNKNEKITFTELLSYMHRLGVEFYGSADWGSTDETCLCVYAKIPGGEIWLVDMLSSPGMEIPTIVRKVKELTEEYRVQKWFCDSNYPAYVKMLKKTKTALGYNIPAVGVKKGKDSVIDGITTVQSKILDGNNTRRFQVLKTESTSRAIDCFEVYSWKKDGQGNPIDGVPEHGNDGTSDIMDSIRYFFYGFFGKVGGVVFSYELEGTGQRNSPISNKIKELATDDQYNTLKIQKKSGIIWDI
jgi:intein/homing endonuclease